MTSGWSQHSSPSQPPNSGGVTFDLVTLDSDGRPPDERLTLNELGGQPFLIGQRQRCPLDGIEALAGGCDLIPQTLDRSGQRFVVLRLEDDRTRGLQRDAKGQLHPPLLNSGEHPGELGMSGAVLVQLSLQCVTHPLIAVLRQTAQSASKTRPNPKPSRAAMLIRPIGQQNHQEA